MMVSISGKTGSVAISDLSAVDFKKNSKKFESEAKIKKIKDSKGTIYFKIEKIGREIYLLIAKQSAILITKWAEHPFSKFMKVREITLEGEFLSMGLHPQSSKAGEQPRLYVSNKQGFQVIDLDGGTSTDVMVDQSIQAQKGAPINSLALQQGNVLLCFEEYGYPVKPNGDPAGKPIKWRSPITASLPLGDTSLVTMCQDNCVDIWSANLFSLLHTFNNSNRIFPLRLNKFNRVVFACVEDKNNQILTSIISIHCDLTKPN